MTATALAPERQPGVHMPEGLGLSPDHVYLNAHNAAPPSVIIEQQAGPANHVEHNLDPCSPDCPEHGAGSIQLQAEHHKCGVDCDGHHGNSHAETHHDHANHSPAAEKGHNNGHDHRHDHSPGHEHKEHKLETYTIGQKEQCTCVDCRGGEHPMGKVEEKTQPVVSEVYNHSPKSAYQEAAVKLAAEESKQFVAKVVETIAPRPDEQSVLATKQAAQAGAIRKFSQEISPPEGTLVEPAATSPLGTVEPLKSKPQAERSAHKSPDINLPAAAALEQTSVQPAVTPIETEISIPPLAEQPVQTKAHVAEGLEESLSQADLQLLFTNTEGETAPSVPPLPDEIYDWLPDLAPAAQPEESALLAGPSEAGLPLLAPAEIPLPGPVPEAVLPQPLPSEALKALEAQPLLAKRAVGVAEALSEAPEPVRAQARQLLAELAAVIESAARQEAGTASSIAAAEKLAQLSRLLGLTRSELIELLELDPTNLAVSGRTIEMIGVLAQLTRDEYRKEFVNLFQSSQQSQQSMSVWEYVGDSVMRLTSLFKQWLFSAPSKA